MQRLLAATATWKSNQDQLRVATQAETPLHASLNDLRADKKSLESQLAGLAHEEARLSRHIAEVDRGQSVLKNLLSQLQAHVVSGTCPLCGEDHGSKDELLRRIHDHVASDAASGARTELAALRRKDSELSERLAVNHKARAAAESSVSRLGTDQVTLRAELATFEDAIAILGITSDPTGPTVDQQLQDLYDVHQREVANLDRQAQQSLEDLGVAQSALTNARAAAGGQVVSLAEQKAVLGEIQAQIDRLREDPHVTRVSLDTEPALLEQLEHAGRGDLANIATVIANAEEAITHLRPQISALAPAIGAISVRSQRRTPGRKTTRAASLRDFRTLRDERSWMVFRERRTGPTKLQDRASKSWAAGFSLLHPFGSRRLLAGYVGRFASLSHLTIAGSR